MSRHQQIETKLTYECVNSVTDWMQSNRLQLNNDKTESLWCTTVRRQYRLPTSGPTIGSFTVTPSSMVLDFGVYIDADLSMHSRVRRNVSRCFTVLRQMRSIRQQGRQWQCIYIISTCGVPVAEWRIAPFTTGLLQWCSVWTACIPHPPSPICSERCCAGLSFGIRWSEHITDALISLHWRHVPERIAFKLAVLTFRSIHATTPSYLQ